ncbi:MAG: hypothetical protein P1V97_18160 [Planctomycetota bacterium]|nr:hypothetical protein [Planctomycetota bacterium]
MSRAVPGPVKAISLIYGFNALLFLLFSGILALELLFYTLGLAWFIPDLNFIGFFGVEVLVIVSFVIGAFGMVNWFTARGLWRGSRLALFFALSFSFLQVMGSIGAILAADFDGAFLIVFAFHVFCLRYLGFNKEVRRAFS